MVLTASAACSVEPTTIVQARCFDDDFCGPGFVCDQGECVPRDAVSCPAIEGGQAILQPSPSRIDFGFTGSGSSQQRLLLRNIGNCTVTVFEASFEAGDRTPFECPFCSPERFPIELFPFREHELNVFFTPDDVGTYEDALVLLSDDSEFTEIRIPVRATFNGVPAATAAPTEVNFDFAPVGRTVSRTVRLRNRGSGAAPLEIQSLAIDTATASAFSFESELGDNSEPLVLRPISGADDSLTVSVRYHPQEVDAHSAELVVTTNEPGRPELRVPMAGSARTPAKVSVSPEQVVFGPVPLGQTTALPITIVNEGGTPLRVTYRWGGAALTTDLSASPAVVPAIAAGQFTELLVLVTATAPTPIQGLLILETNDPMRPTLTIPVSAEGQSVVGAEVLKIDMNFENGGDSTFDDDFRNVNMTLENPFGLVVNEDNPRPTDWMQFGNPTWIAFGPKQEPERIVLPDAQQDGTYRVLLSYEEDCASVPSSLVAALLGVSIDALVAYLAGGSVGGLNAGQISEVVEMLCLDRASSAVTLTIFVNGAVIAEVPATLNRRNEYIYAADIIRQNGQFSVRP